MKKYAVVGIILLFIASSVTPLVIGFSTETKDIDIELEAELANLRYLCTTPDGFNEAEFESYKEELLNSYSKDDTAVVEPVEAVVYEETYLPLDGPMDYAWPMKCHDLHHTSRSPYSTADNPGFEKWRYKCNEVESSAIIDNDDTVYFGSMDFYLYSLHSNGTLKWKYKTGDLVWSTPAIAEDGTIYVTSYDDYLHAVYPNGTRKWRFGAGDSISSSPAIAEDGIIYFGCNNKKIFAVNPNGTKKWHYTTGDMIVSDPVIGDDETIYIGSLDGYFYALWPNGTLRWRFKTGDWVKGHPSIADDGTIYFPSWDDNLYALYPNGTMKWKVNTGWGATGGAAIAGDGTIYLFTNRLRAIYPNNGTIKWSLDIGGDGGHTSPAISLDGTIYVCNDEGKSIVAVNPDGTEKWRREICNLRADSSPCIGEDGTIYVGSSQEDENTHFWFGYLHAFGAGGELEADADGPYYGLINLPVQFSGSASYGYPPYTWFWDFGDGNTSNEQNPAHTYATPGNFSVTLIVTDDSGNTSDDTTWAGIQASNDPPDIPEIDGYTSGTAGKPYPYVFETSDIDGNHIWYYIEWGDGSDTGWIGHYPSGEEITKSHSWSEKDTYTIRCKAKDPYESESEWATLEVTMPVNQQNSYPLLELFRERFPVLYQLFMRVLEVNLFDS